MNLNGVSSVGFNGKYKLDANQKMPNNDACYMRDMTVGFWTAQAKNRDTVETEKFPVPDRGSRCRRIRGKSRIRGSCHGTAAVPGNMPSGGRSPPGSWCR